MFHAHHHLHKRKRKSLKKFPHPNKWIRFLDHSILAIAIIGPVMNLPQILKIYLNHSAAGVSALTFSLLFVISIVWLIYGVVHQEKPIIASSSLWLVSHAFVIAGAIMYG